MSGVRNLRCKLGTDGFNALGIKNRRNLEIDCHLVHFLHSIELI